MLRLQLLDLLPENPEFLLKDLDFWPSHRRAIVSNQPESLIFGFSVSKIGGSHVFTSRPTDIPQRFRKRPKNLPLSIKTPQTPPTHANTHIYPLIYKPLPNSRRLQHTALRYVQRVQLGQYMWRKGPNLVKRGSKWAHFTCLCTQGSAISFGKTRFRPICDPVLVPIWPLFKALWGFPWATKRHHVPKMGYKHFFEHP